MASRSPDGANGSRVCAPDDRLRIIRDSCRAYGVPGLRCAPSGLRALLAHFLDYALELLRRRIEHEQRAFGDAEIGAVQLELAALDEGADEGERHQVFE